MPELTKLQDTSSGDREPLVRSRGVVVVKTANYQLIAGDFGKTFTNRGAAGSVTLTLPAPALCKAGNFIRVLKMTPGQNIVVAANGNTIVGPATPFTGTTAITHSTANERASLELEYDGTAWLATPSGTWTIS